MENDPYSTGSRRDRLMGKLFKKEKKIPDNDSQASLNAFLHSSADSLNVVHPPPPPPPASAPKLAKLDTTVTRFPQALGVNQQAQNNRPLALGRPDSKSPRPSPRPNKKGLLVRFSDTYPEIIGEGGDETDVPTVEISKRKAANPPPPPVPPPARMPSHAQRQRPPGAPIPPSEPSQQPPSADDFQPKPLSRTATGYSSVYSPESDEESDSTPQPPPIPAPRVYPSQRVDPAVQPRQEAENNTLRPGRAASARYLDNTGRHDEARRSFIEIHQAQMRQAEGQAFAKAARTASSASQHDWVDGDRPPSPSIDGSPERTRNYTVSPDSDFDIPAADYSPAASIHSNSSSNYGASGQSPPISQALPPRLTSRDNSAVSSQNDLPIRRPTQRTAPPPAPPSHDSAVGQDDMALQAFVMRTTHLFELFRLHAETTKPIANCGPKDCARAGLWWFLKGRMGLETTIRERPTTPQSQMQNEIDRQQAYTNLAKGYWLCHEIVPEISRQQGSVPEAEVTEVGQNLVSALKKLSMSMQRNGLLPPEDAFLPQTLDKSIWIEYPTLSQDIVALLSGNWGSGISAMQHPLSSLHLLDAFPLGDTPDTFSYGRVMADTYLMEQGRESQRFHFPSMLSMVRPQKHTGLVFVVASQNGNLQLPIQENKNAGPVWDDVRWRSENCALEIRMPRGFLLVVQLTQQDFRTLWSMYDFGAKVKTTLYPRKDEQMVFRNTLRSFQYIDSDPQSRMFPKDPVSQCDLALFEKIYKESGPTGVRSWHRGFRIAVVTGPKTRTLSGVHHTYPPYMPIQFGFFRTEGDAPALSLRFENGRQKGRMVLNFTEEKERVQFHSMLTGTALDHDERIFADTPIKSFTLGQSLREPLGMAPFSRIPWKAARIVNEEFGPSGEQPPTVLADKLKLVYEYQNGTVTDRANVGPGELRIRLEVSNAKVLRILRQPQDDMTISVSEAQVPKELPRNFYDALQLVKTSPTIRTIEFEGLKNLHDFQAALTGFEVMFDGLAATFAIQRRRMVVPIHKKWEAGYTRIQVVKQDDKLQLLAFFEDFVHGHCMNFVLKGTDVYESFQRSGKAGIRFVDAKFPLPRLPQDKDGDYDDMAFVSLDLPDLPGEHDDILLLFEKDTGESSRVPCPRLVVIELNEKLLMNAQIVTNWCNSCQPLLKDLPDYPRG